MFNNIPQTWWRIKLEIVLEDVFNIWYCIGMSVIRCSKCHGEVDHIGGLLSTLPDDITFKVQSVERYVFCMDCTDDMINYMKG